MASAVTVVKFVLILFNVILAIFCIIGMGFKFMVKTEIVSLYDTNEAETSQQQKYTGEATGFYIILAFFAVMGAIGAYFKNCCALTCYAIFFGVLTFMFGALGGVSLWVSTEFTRFEEGKNNTILPVELNNYQWNRDTSVSMKYPSEQSIKIDSMQKSFNCCGLENYTDWNKVRPNGVERSKFPDSCCSEKNQTKICTRGRSDFQETGCTKIVHELGYYVKVLAYSFTGIAAILLLLIILSYTLICIHP